MEPLAQTSRSALLSELILVKSEMNAIGVYSGGFMFVGGEQESRFADLMRALMRLGSCMNKISVVCSVLVDARDTDRKRTSG